jgi:6-phosphogluconolactonase (cycloisomerase 2 family)
MRFGIGFASLAVLVVLSLAGCSDEPSGTTPLDPSQVFGTATSGGSGGVYTMTNAAAGNAVVAFRRADDGSLTSLGSFLTGGTGTGGGVDPLQSQYSLILDESHQFLFVANAGSDDISVFQVLSGGALRLVDRTDSGGDFPISLAVRSRELFVLNAGDNVVARFQVQSSGVLVAHGKISLAAGAAGASTIVITATGDQLIVTERDANRLETIHVNPVTSQFDPPVVSPSSGAVPFGFDLDAVGHVIVTEALGQSPSGAISSYFLSANGTLSVITPSANANGGATCWVIVTSAGFAFATNTSSGTLTSASVSGSGLVAILSSTAGATGLSAPIDLDLSANQRFLYVLEAGTGNLRTFGVSGPTLIDRGTTPAGAGLSGMQGVAAF